VRSGHGQTRCRLDPVARDPNRTSSPPFCCDARPDLIRQYSKSPRQFEEMSLCGRLAFGYSNMDRLPVDRYCPLRNGDILRHGRRKEVRVVFVTAISSEYGLGSP